MTKYDKIGKKEQGFSYTPATLEFTRFMGEQFFTSLNIVNQRAVFVPAGRAPGQFWEWLNANAEHLGIQKIEPQDTGVLVEWNKRGSQMASFLFKVRNAWEFPANTEAAIRRDQKEAECGQQ